MATKTLSRPREKGPPAAPKTKSDAYVGMLALALVAQIAGAAFLYLDYSSYPDNKKPPLPADRPQVTGVKQPDLPPPAPAPAPAPAEKAPAAPAEKAPAAPAEKAAAAPKM